jgi:hypothetical protein
MTNSAGKGERVRPHPPFSQPDPGRRTTPVSERQPAAAPSELPSIEQFVDDLPSIEEFRLESEAGHREGDSFASQEEGWAPGDWQSYDWSRIASLGAPASETTEAQTAWSSTDWNSAARGLSDTSGGQGALSGNDVAAALDEIARRIRSGQLSLERFAGTPPEAAIAAAFAAFLRGRG